MCCTNCVKCGKSTCHLDPKPSQIGMGFLFNAITLALQNTFETLNGMLLYLWLFFFNKGRGHRDRKVFVKHLLQFICLHIYKLLVWEITLQSRSLKRKSCREGGGNNLKYISLCFLRYVIQFRVIHIEMVSEWFMYTRLELLIKASDFFRFLTM